MNLGKVVKSNQEQAVASWINYLNRVRLDRFMVALQQQDQNWIQAVDTLKDTLFTINKEVIERNRGGLKGMHGFIAEVAECGIGNAREQVQGKVPVYEWINDNGPADLLWNGVQIQQKFVASGNHLSLQAITQHLKKYPDFLSEGGKYQIPEDHYEQIKLLLSISKDQANKMPTSTGEFSLKQWKEVHDFFDKGTIKLQDIQPSKLKYDQVQVNRINDTIQNEKQSLKEVDQKIRQEAYAASKPSLEQEVKVTALSAAIEGGAAFVSVIAKKRKSGKKIGEFDSKDWEEIFKESGIGVIKGGVRGISIYSLTNFTATPAAVASSLCTASFGIAEQAYLLRTGKITKDQFIMNSEILCLETSVSALSSCVGQALIPVPVLGAVLGNTIGTLLYQVAKDNLTKTEQRLIKDYYKYLHELDSKLEDRYRTCIEELKEEMVTYYVILEKAFAPNCTEALNGSVALAMYFGVPREELLTTIDEIDMYFMGQ
ncbi:hypothetical protein [Butyrivibrio fibrisolvens]|uniref:hypothetical protein n=1 Tax=Butyrivibrio fibrisolvens TaxID=831 RepID=UPI00040C5114|nr:hypothetical protein [Butyrivibrio fibrisolvens]